MKYLLPLLLLAGCAGTLDQPPYSEFNPDPMAFILAVDLWNDYQPTEVPKACIVFIKKIEFVLLPLDEVHYTCQGPYAIACYLGTQSDGVARILLSETEEAVSLKVQTHELIHALGDCVQHDPMADHKEDIWKAVEKIK